MLQMEIKRNLNQIASSSAFALWISSLLLPKVCDSVCLTCSVFCVCVCVRAGKWLIWLPTQTPAGTRPFLSEHSVPRTAVQPWTP